MKFVHLAARRAQEVEECAAQEKQELIKALLLEVEQNSRLIGMVLEEKGKNEKMRTPS